MTHAPDETDREGAARQQKEQKKIIGMKAIRAWSWTLTKAPQHYCIAPVHAGFEPTLRPQTCGRWPRGIYSLDTDSRRLASANAIAAKDTRPRLRTNYIFDASKPSTAEHSDREDAESDAEARVPSIGTVLAALRSSYPIRAEYTSASVTVAMAMGLRQKLIAGLGRAQSDRFMARKIARRRSDWPDQHDEIDLSPAERVLAVAKMLSELTPDTRFRPAVPKSPGPPVLSDRQTIAAIILEAMEPLHPAPWRFDKTKKRATSTAEVLIGIIYAMDRLAAQAAGKGKPKKLGPKAAAAALNAARQRREQISLRRRGLDRGVWRLCNCP